MAQHLAEYRSTTLSTLLAHKKFLEAIINSISDPIIGLDPDRKILFINSEALNILNLKKENTIFKSAEEIKEINTRTGFSQSSERAYQNICRQ